MWIRQEYMSEKARYEKPFQLEISLPVEAQETNEARIKDLEKSSKPKSTRTIKIAQSAAAIGTTVWDGSIVLAKMFDSREIFPLEYLRQSRVLELGAGCGLVGIYLCLLGAKRTVMTDLACCVPNMQKNIAINVRKERQESIEALEYKWGKDTLKLVSDGLYDIVVGAEVLYDEKDSVTLANSILELIHEDSKVFVSMERKSSWRSELHCSYGKQWV